MRAEEIREMGDADIVSRIAELEEERFRLRFRSATETLEDPLRLRAIRRDVARLKTVLRERVIGIEQARAASAPAAGTAKAGTSKASTPRRATKRGARR